MAAYEVPLSAAPQRFNIPLAGVFYWLTLYWCEPAQCWTLNIADSDDVMLIGGIALVTGADLLEQYRHLGIGGQLVAQSDTDITQPPTKTSLGVTGHLFFVTE